MQDLPRTLNKEDLPCTLNIINFMTSTNEDHALYMDFNAITYMKNTSGKLSNLHIYNWTYKIIFKNDSTKIYICWKHKTFRLKN